MPPFFIQWCYDTQIGETIRNSLWLFPILEAFHLVGFGFIAGAVLTVDLRLLGVGMTHQPVARLANGAEPWIIAGVVLMFSTGVPLFLSESLKCYFNPAFWIKMGCLLLVLILTFTYRRSVTRAAVTLAEPAHARAMAITSILLWFGVAWGGRWIGFS